jgi:hypothetical protein
LIEDLIVMAARFAGQRVIDNGKRIIEVTFTNVPKR